MVWEIFMHITYESGGFETVDDCGMDTQLENLATIQCAAEILLKWRLRVDRTSIEF